MEDFTVSLFRTARPGRWFPVSNRVGGGVSQFGENQTRPTSPAGRWRVEFEVMIRSDADARRWESLLARWNNGDEKIVVHRAARGLGLTWAGDNPVDHAADATFADGTRYSGGQASATVEGALEVGATTATVRVEGARPLEGGEPFTIVGADYGARLYSVGEVLSAEQDGAGMIYEISFTPRLREDVADGTAVDFNQPRCTMKVQVNADLWPDYDLNGDADVTVAFEETWT